MTIEPRSYPTGVILAFNGTTEWALDSVAQADALWLPREDQLRELRGAFRRLTARRHVPRRDRVRRRTHAFEHPSPTPTPSRSAAVLRRIS
jgi:hypothetical protein